MLPGQARQPSLLLLPGQGGALTAGQALQFTGPRPAVRQWSIRRRCPCRRCCLIPRYRRRFYPRRVFSQAVPAPTAASILKAAAGAWIARTQLEPLSHTPAVRT